jgi:hypothetical protein
MYLALGDPLQKRNYYRAGWLRFRDDADMLAVMSELSEKKVCCRFLFHHSYVSSYSLYRLKASSCTSRTMSDPLSIEFAMLLKWPVSLTD